MTVIAPLVAHAFGILLSLWGGQALIGRLLVLLRIYNADAQPGVAGPRYVGRTIGLAERFIVYVAVLAGQPAWLAVVFTLKTIVRYPELQASASPNSSGTDGHSVGTQCATPSPIGSPASPVEESSVPAGAFAEYYLVGTLLSLAVGVAVPLAMLWTLRLLLHVP